MIMKKYKCKYCDRTFTLPQINYMLTLVDHIIIKHRDIIPELEGIYLQDIPTKCFTIESEDKEIEQRNRADIVGTMWWPES